MPQDQRSDADTLPEIAVRIPGRWTGAMDLERALPHGYMLTEGWLLLPCGDRVEVSVLPPDRQFPELFIRGCRRSLGDDDRALLRSYGVNVCLMRPGGSVGAARRMLQAAASLVAAGGMGVFVDNSGNAHDATEWVGFACDRDASAAILAFVGIYSDCHEVWSVGMHVLGLRDAVMPFSGEEQADVALLSSLLGYTLARDTAVAPGDFVGDGLERSFQVNPIEHPRIPAGHPMSNPYGCWRLDPVGTR